MIRVHKPILTQDQQNQVRRLFDCGIGFESIANKVGTKSVSVAEYLRVNKLKQSKEESVFKKKALYIILGKNPSKIDRDDMRQIMSWSDEYVQKTFKMGE